MEVVMQQQLAGAQGSKPAGRVHYAIAVGT
jgi:hypothetical protein